MQTHKKSISTAEHYKWAETCDGWHLLERDDFSVIEERVPPGKSESFHFHDAARQFFFVLEGEATLEVCDEVIKLGKHEGFEVPPRLSHQLRNESFADTVFLVMSVPKSHGDRFDIR
ncbi:MAG TPA: cupin domain-containing protein [Capsulimonadaceae bacterium]|jgi:mannose-6-phosphate isomerase-like protein (cupin superfamily)